MILAFGLLVFGLLFTTASSAAHLCPTTGPGVEWAATCFEANPQGRHVKQRYIKRLRPNRGGYTTVMISEPRELVAVDRRGKVVVPGIIHTGDYDFPTTDGSLARFTTGNNVHGAEAPSGCGYFDTRSFRIVVPAEYDHCKAYTDGEAIACKKCESFCVEPECRDRVLVGGEGVVLGSDGKVRKRFALPHTKPACTLQPSHDGANSANTAAPALPCSTNATDLLDQLK